MSDNTQRQIVELIKKHNRILVLPSSPPDGDSLGSAIALYMGLKKLKKEVTVICNDPVPEVLQFLPNTKIIGKEAVSSNDFIITIDCKNVKVDSIKSNIEDDKVNIIITPKEGKISKNDLFYNLRELDYDLIITVDTAETSQLGEFYQENVALFQQIPVINIDHHISNTHFGKINHVDIMSSSTTELLLPLFEQISEDTGTQLIDEDVATLLLTGIITDTGSFQNANTTPKAFAKAAKLISYGARQQEIIQHIYKTKQLSQLKLWGRVLSKIQTDEKHRIVWSVVTRQDFKDTESSEQQTGDVIDELMTNAPGAEVIMLMREREDGKISVSLRTTNPHVDASTIAENYGGGGHTQAAGFRLENTDIREAEFKVIEFIKKFQAKRLNVTEQNQEEPMINVKELIHRAKEAQKATETIEQNVPAKNKKTKEKFNPKSPANKEISSETTEIKPGITYKFED